MRRTLQTAAMLASVCLPAITTLAQDATVPSLLLSNSDITAPVSLSAQEPSGGQEPTMPNLSPKNGRPNPVNGEQKFTYVLLDVFEYRPKGNDSDFRWDVEGWHGGDYNRFWFKTEGQRNTALKADYDLDLQLLYGRFIKRYYDFSGWYPW